jgi:hypothetical protein
MPKVPQEMVREWDYGKMLKKAEGLADLLPLDKIPVEGQPVDPLQDLAAWGELVELVNKMDALISPADLDDRNKVKDRDLATRYNTLIFRCQDWNNYMHRLGSITFQKNSGA